jgi:hypothetical protein
MTPRHLNDIAKDAIVKVGSDGRGFLLATPRGSLIVTAAHCLPYFPDAAPFFTSDERTYFNHLAHLGPGELTVSAECLFCDPVGDIAVLGSPDRQELPDEAKPYERMVEGARALFFAEASEEPSTAFLVTLSGGLARCLVEPMGRGFWISKAEHPIEGGMSGSPILNAEGAAIGVVVCSSTIWGEANPYTSGGPNPRLDAHLPGWLLRQLRGN